jgi:hypothetical protein
MKRRRIAGSIALLPEAFNPKSPFIPIPGWSKAEKWVRAQERSCGCALKRLFGNLG